jgi:hypothetical protein
MTRDSWLTRVDNPVLAKHWPGGAELDRFFGRGPSVEWDQEAALTPSGQLPFFIHILLRRGDVGSSPLKRGDGLEPVDERVERETRFGGGRILNYERVADNAHSKCLHSGQGARKGFAAHSEL